MNVWWSCSPKLGNFGDMLTPHILRHFGIPHQWSALSQADAISTGSIIRFARSGVHVFGSGAMWSTDKICPGANYKWVRGPITGEMVRRSGAYCPDIYGDPAMLLPRIFPRTVDPVHEIGIFPHYVDLDQCSKYPVVVSPLDPVPDVLRKLWSCKRIISSSLHGIIAAHAYGIPAAWVKMDGKLDGDDTKFHDHALSVCLPEMPLSTVDSPIFTTGIYNDAGIAEIIKNFSDEYMRSAFWRRV